MKKLFFLIHLILVIQPANAQSSSRIGVGYGAHYDGEPFINFTEDLGVDHYYINIKWGSFEALPGQYQDSILDAFLQQIPVNSQALIRISPRNNTLYNDPNTDFTIPLNLSVGSPYYNFVRHIVARDTAHKVKFYENEWEYNFTPHWGGKSNPHPDPLDLGNKYADLTRTTEAAILSANPNALFILGGTTRSTNAYTETLLKTTFANLSATDPVKGHCDFYDQHLYRDLYSIPEALRWFQTIRNDFPAFANKPVISTEYGGPLPTEFAKDSSLNHQLDSLLANDICLLAGDLHIQGFDFPPEYRMFAYGVDSSLSAKRDSIQASNYVQRTLLGMANGVERMYWWNLEEEWSFRSSPTGTCYLKNGNFGKLALLENDFDNNLTGPSSNYPRFKKFVEIFKNITSLRQDSSFLSQDIYLFELGSEQNDTLYVVWEKRDQFYGVYNPLTSFLFALPWKCVRLRNIFGRDDTTSTAGGALNIDINDIPLIISKCDGTLTNTRSLDDITPSFSVFPNPSESIVTLHINGYQNRAHITLFNMIGQLIYARREINSNELIIDLTDFPGGIYFARLTNHLGVSQTVKFILK